VGGHYASIHPSVVFFSTMLAILKTRDSGFF
jgi:hypothetical protein